MINTDKDVSRKSSSPNPGVLGGLHDAPSPQDNWEFELDLLGTSASVEALERHLEKAPDPQSATAQFLKGYIASHEQSR